MGPTTSLVKEADYLSIILKSFNGKKFFFIIFTIIVIFPKVLDFMV